MLPPTTLDHGMTEKIISPNAPAVIASANVGCMGHLQGVTDVPVRHWIELIDERLAS